MKLKYHQVILDANARNEFQFRHVSDYPTEPVRDRCWFECKLCGSGAGIEVDEDGMPIFCVCDRECPKCDAPSGEPCRTPGGTRVRGRRGPWHIERTA